jgi:hypothetical protein
MRRFATLASICVLIGFVAVVPLGAKSGSGGRSGGSHAGGGGNHAGGGAVPDRSGSGSNPGTRDKTGPSHAEVTHSDAKNSLRGTPTKDKTGPSHAGVTHSDAKNSLRGTPTKEKTGPSRAGVTQSDAKNSLRGTPTKEKTGPSRVEVTHSDAKNSLRGTPAKDTPGKNPGPAGTTKGKSDSQNNLDAEDRSLMAMGKNVRQGVKNAIKEISPVMQATGAGFVTGMQCVQAVKDFNANAAAGCVTGARDALRDAWDGMQNLVSPSTSSQKSGPLAQHMNNANSAPGPLGKAMKVP